MIIRSTENQGIPFFENIKKEILFCDLQGLIFGAPREAIENAINTKELLPLTGIEAIQLENNEPLETSHRAFSNIEWKLKKKFCQSLNSELFLLTFLQNCHTIEEVGISSSENIEFTPKWRFNGEELATWWKTKKGTMQIKKMYEARPRQHRTVFDNVLESRGTEWGGNIDGVIFDRLEKPIAILETRCSHRDNVKTYDPSRYFHGTFTKKGDYMTWLPPWYLSQVLEIPLLLLTFSTVSPSLCGAAKIGRMTESGISYEDTAPPENIFSGSHECVDWILKKTS